MKKHYCKILAGILTVAMLMGCLCGCSGNQPTTEAPAKEEPAAAETVKEENKSSNKVVELRWLSAQIGESPEAAWFAKTVEDFNKLYEGKIKINVDGVAGEAVDEKLRADAAGGTMPDLFMLNADAARFNLIADAECAADLTPYMENNPELWDRIDKDSAKAYTDKNGHLLGLPYAKAFHGIYYNTELFANAGIETFPTTWDEFFEACDALVASGVAPIAMMTGENSWTTMLVLTHIIGSTGGEEWLKSKPEDVNFNDPVFISAAEKLQTMLSKYSTIDTVGATYAVAANNFLNGKAAMIANGPWMIGDFSNPEIAMEGLETKVAYAPAPGNGVVQAENISYAIGSTDPVKRDAAFEVLKYLATPEVYAGFLNVSGNSPCINLDTSLLELDPINALFLPIAMNADAKYGTFADCTKVAVIDGLGQYLPSLADGSLTPAEFAANLQALSDGN